MIELKGCLSPHVSMAQRDHTRLAWLASDKGVTRLRVITWTCQCRATLYELCQAGGQGFIRRTLQLDGSPEVHETYRWPIRQASDIWRALLSGEAR
ncbi:hypothetical protein [Streptosporangium sp. 'caverna']|uniref:hypothetical protein n=1 Tax=Streptosporangium sp. 'caverna' TaxID=2202249 RepID=UPI000D7D7252|nr:hypothetical protein [Streptosporangium sp. 'caverna']AWS40193.1 hypothetical protein DKM19_01450 [Streptosporangium sp. 'caverna']